MSHARFSGSRRRLGLELVLTPEGQAELVHRDNVLWSSMEDDEFRSSFENEVIQESDVQNVLDYLVENDVITENEAGSLEIIEEALGPEDEDSEPDEETGEFDDKE